MKNKKMIIAVVAVVAVIALLLGVYTATRPKTIEGGKNVTIVVVYQDGTEKKQEFYTAAEYLSELLVAENLAEGYESEEYGFTITGVDGISPDWNTDGAYWALYEGDTYAITSASGIVLVEGGVYKLVYETF